LTKLTNLVGSH